MLNYIERLRNAIKFGKTFDYNGHAYDVSDRTARSVAVGELINTLPPSELNIDALTTLLLYEEITDSHPDKTANNEYPFFSDTQLARRKGGVHRKNDGGGLREVSMMHAEYVSTDGRDYKYPTRRKRDDRENRFMDENARIRNKERREKYNAFKRGDIPGVVTVNIETGAKMGEISDIYNV